MCVELHISVSISGWINLRSVHLMCTFQEGTAVDSVLVLIWFERHLANVQCLANELYSKGSVRGFLREMHCRLQLRKAVVGQIRPLVSLHWWGKQLKGAWLVVPCSVWCQVLALTLSGGRSLSPGQRGVGDHSDGKQQMFLESWDLCWGNFSVASYLHRTALSSRALFSRMGGTDFPNPQKCNTIVRL